MTQVSKKPTLVVMAGGTGGHIFPGLAVVEALREQLPQLDVHWIGTADRMEAQIIPKEGIPIHFIEVKGVRGRGVLALLKAPVLILLAILQALRVLLRIKPQLVLGFGGYAAGPGAIAAMLLRIPIFIHEQNAAVGSTNKLLARHVTRAFSGFSLPQHDTFEPVGNPLRAAFRQAAAELRTQPRNTHVDGKNKQSITVIGGSLGAQVLNQQLPSMLSQLTEVAGEQLELLHQAGKGNSAAVRASYQQAFQQQGWQHLSSNEQEQSLRFMPPRGVNGLPPITVTVVDFITDVATVLAGTSLLISRAGALTVAESSWMRVPTIFVPLPHAIDDHQRLNADALVSQGAAWMVLQHQLSERLPRLLTQLLSEPQAIADVRHALAEISTSDAAERMAKACAEVLVGGTAQTDSGQEINQQNKNNKS